MKLRFASLSLLAICLLAAVPAFANDVTLYPNGTVTSSGGAHDYNIKSPYSVSDPFTVVDSDIETLSIEYWDHSNTVFLNTVQMALGSTAFSGSFETLTALSNTLQSGTANSHGYYLVVADFTFPSIDWINGGWITLENATIGTGGTVLWDASDASLDAYNSSNGGVTKTAVYGETFSLDGDITPEPSSLLLLGSGMLGLAGMLRRKLAR